VIMEEDIQALDETIVVAYGNTTRRKSTGAISVVKGEELRGIPAASIATLLQGRVAGMDVTQMSGAPGGGGTAVTIRGYNSLDVEQGRRFSNPLWVVDGVPMNSFSSPITGTNLLSDLNPDMIESIQVLKDASSAAIYGSRAANGVILVTTKKGKQNQRATFSANVSYTWSMLPKLPTVTTGRGERLHRLRVARDFSLAYVDPETNRYKYPTTLREQYDHYANGAKLDDNFIEEPNNTSNGSMLQDSLNSFYNNSTNYFPIYYVKGKVINANIQTYGGSEKMTYGIGLGYYNEKGIFRGTGYNRVDLNSTMNVTPVNRLNVDCV
ncbi:MAG: TonB-dependent receptor plug domain-containing protein, partial [Butyricimonas faecihominis]